MSTTYHHIARAFGAGSEPCMGGWCTQRGHCHHYHAQSRSEPSERLCAPGHDGERLQRAEAFDFLAPSQVPSAEEC